MTDFILKAILIFGAVFFIFVGGLLFCFAGHAEHNQFLLTLVSVFFFGCGCMTIKTYWETFEY